MTKPQIKKFASEFRKGLLDSRQPESMCFAVTSPLVTLLNMHGVECQLKEGSVGDTNHFWIELPDGAILDPTADQFTDLGGATMPPVYIGKKPEWYMAELKGD